MSSNVTTDDTKKKSPEILVAQGSGNDRLQLLFLGCEAKPPYGPYRHTATLFLNLLRKSCPTKTIHLKVYHASEGQLPTSAELQSCDGVILPGSFNSAYDTDAWVVDLRTLIQDELVRKGIKTLGTCFGHQLYAHSFPNANTTKCPAGPQAGHKTFAVSQQGLDFFSKSTLDLYYTHGDMVESLPSQGISLGGNENVPIQAALYTSTATTTTNNNNNNNNKSIMAVTFQAHPEFITDHPTTLLQIINAMEERGDVYDGPKIKQMAQENFSSVETDSIHVIKIVGTALGWF
jgi:GMP synthase-like glutamine amidotransferase